MLTWATTTERKGKGKGRGQREREGGRGKERKREERKLEGKEKKGKGTAQKGNGKGKKGKQLAWAVGHASASFAMATKRFAERKPLAVAFPMSHRNFRHRLVWKLTGIIIAYPKIMHTHKNLLHSTTKKSYFLESRVDTF